MVVCAWAIIFPYVRRGTFENSAIAWRIGGVPVLSILGLVATIGIVPVLYLLIVDTRFSLDLGYVMWGAVLSVSLGFIWYIVWRAIERKRGHMVESQFAEIPIE